MGRGLDRLDVLLLNLLQHNNLATADQLADSVPLSPSAITRRVRRARELGLIAADTAILSPRFLQNRLRAIVQLQLHENADAATVAAFRDRLRNSEHIQSCFEITGAFDLLAIVVAREIDAFNRFADDTFAGDPAVRRYETNFIKKEVKNRPTIRLDDRDAGQA